MFTPEVATVLEAVPEFKERFCDLVEEADGDPGGGAAFTELAEFVASLLARPRPSLAVLSRCLAGVEQVARESEDADELVVWSFLDRLSPDDLKTIFPWLGPCTRDIAGPLVSAEDQIPT